MRATRAYLASLGTTGLLVLAAFAILIAASTLLAFNGWPGGGVPERATPVLIDPGREAGATGGPVEVAAEAAAAADEVATLADTAPGDGDGDGSGPGGGDGPGGDSPGGDTPPDRAPGDRSPGGGTPDTPTGGTPGTPTEGTPSVPPPPPPPGNLSLTDGLADGVESATDFLGDDAVSQLSPQLGQVVTGTGEVLTDLVRALDGTAAPRR